MDNNLKDTRAAPSLYKGHHKSNTGCFTFLVSQKEPKYGALALHQVHRKKDISRLVQMTWI